MSCAFPGTSSLNPVLPPINPGFSRVAAEGLPPIARRAGGETGRGRVLPLPERPGLTWFFLVATRLTTRVFCILESVIAVSQPVSRLNRFVERPSDGAVDPPFPTARFSSRGRCPPNNLATRLSQVSISHGIAKQPLKFTRGRPRAHRTNDTARGGVQKPLIALGFFRFGDSFLCPSSGSFKLVDNCAPPASVPHFFPARWASPAGCCWTFFPRHQARSA